MRFLLLLIPLWLIFPLRLLWDAEAEIHRQALGQKDQLVLGSWSAPRNLDIDYFQMLVDLRFTHTLYWRSPKINPEQWKIDLNRAQQLGLRLIFDSWQPAAVPKKWLDAVLKTACSHPAFGGIYAPDEPGYRYPFEGIFRQPSVEHFSSALKKLQACGRGDLFQVDAASADEKWIRLFLPYCTVFGLDIYPYKIGVDWQSKVKEATARGIQLAQERPLWMVLHGHGRGDWFDYATQILHMDIPLEKDPRPDTRTLLKMATIALESGAHGVWWWSFELYNWRDPEHRRFLLQFGDVHQELWNHLENELVP